MSMIEKCARLAERCDKPGGADNALDVEIEIALFQPDELYLAVRANAAGTKVIYTDHGGNEATHWARDWTMDRPAAADALRAMISAALTQEGGV